MKPFAVIVLAAGRSSRFQDKHYRKPFVPLDNRAVWLHSVERFLQRDDVGQVLVVVSKDDRQMFQEKFGANIAILGLQVVEGGDQRGDSVKNALCHVRPECEFVAVHDAARPCLVDEWIDRVFEAGRQSGAALLAVPVVATLKRASQRTVQETVPRAALWEAQTPQVFRRQLLLDAYAHGDAGRATDDAEMVEKLGHPVTLIQGSPLNIKITTREDLRLAEAVLKVLPKPKLLGFDHPFANDDMWR